MRPTRNVPIGQMDSNKYRTSVMDENCKEKEDKMHWKSVNGWTHWDLNPWAWTLNKSVGNDYIFDNFISENNGTKNDGTLKLQGNIFLGDIFV